MTRGEWGQRGGLLAGGAVLGIGLAELLLRAWAWRSVPVARTFEAWDPAAVSIELLSDHCHRPRPHAVTYYPNGAVARTNGQGARGPEVAPAKPAGVVRILLLGGSTTYGFGVNDDATIAVHLEGMLRAHHPHRAIEVVNLGADASTAACDAERLRLDGVPLDPDIVIVHTGINDVAGARFAAPPVDRGHPLAGTMARLRDERTRGGPTPWTRLKHHLLLARVPGLLRLRWNLGAAPLPGPATPAPHALDAFEATLRRMRALLEPGVLVLMSMPPSSLGFAAPPLPFGVRHLVVDAATTQRYRDALAERLRRVAAASGPGTRFVAHDVPRERFLDDCHLDAEGNRQVAAAFAAAIEAWWRDRGA